MQIDLMDLEMPIALRPAAPFTDEDLIEFSERNKPFKIERNRDGEITIMTPVGGIGGTHEMYVSRMLANWTEEDGRGVAFGPNTGFNLHDGSCLSPDGSWMPLELWDALSAEQQASFPPICPPFVIEVRSRSDSRRLLETKMQLWMENGAELGWLIDPIAGVVTIYQQGKAEQTLERPETIRGTTPVEGFILQTARLWPPAK